MQGQPIDHVYTWVNANDEALAAERNRLALSEVDEDHAYRSGAARFVDNGELKASLISAFRFLPFIRKTYIFGGGDPPDWLHEFGDRCTYIPQRLVIPQPVWPNFQSSLVEAYIHSIPGLAERYIYSNDDFFFSQPHSPDDFFTDQGRLRVGLARYTAANGPTKVYRDTEENSVRALNRHIPLPPFHTNLPSLSEGVRLRRRWEILKLRLKLMKRGLPLVNALAHVSQPYLRSFWPGFLSMFHDELEIMRGQRFRSSAGYKTNFMYQYYMKSLGLAELSLYNTAVIVERRHGSDYWNWAEKEILGTGSTINRFCLNDTPVETEDGWDRFVLALTEAVVQRPHQTR